MRLTEVVTRSASLFTPLIDERNKPFYCSLHSQKIAEKQNSFPEKIASRRLDILVDCNNQGFEMSYDIVMIIAKQTTSESRVLNYINSWPQL
jgi:hypothetical protein